MGLSIARYGQDGGSHLCTACQDNAPRGRGARRVNEGSGEETAGKSRVRGPETLDPVVPERLRAKSRTETSTSALQFQVKTSEGDTVTLSVNAVQQSSSDRVSYQSKDGSLRASQRTQSSSIQANVSVEGNLSEEELADISKALETLSQGKTLESLGTLESASFQYNNRTVSSQSQLSYVG